MNSNLITKGVRYALMAGAVTSVAAPSAFAADADQNTTATTPSTTQLGKIEVTGTRIKRTDVETAQPVTIITAQQLKATGLSSIGDILQTVTESGAAINTSFNNGGNGSTTLDLRYLAPKRLLVLVNGRRWIPGLGGAVDLNEIPVAIIDHIEILQDGASAIYGSDAIAGVVNIITIANFNGAEANVYTSIYHNSYLGFNHNDGKIQEYDFTIGTSGDKSGVVVNASYVNQHEVWAADRAQSKEPIWTAGPASGSSAPANGRFLFVGPALAGKTYGSGGCNPVYAPASHSYGTCDLGQSAPDPGSPTPTTNFTNFLTSERFNFAPLNYFVTPNERISLYTQGHYDIADNITFSTEATFNKRVSQQALAPSPLFLGFGESTENGSYIGVGKTNPFNPFGVDLVGNLSQFCTSVGPGCPTTNDLAILIGRRPVEGGLRLFNQDVETYQINMGLKGFFNIGGNEWDWDISSGYADDDNADITTGLFNTARLAQALDSPGFAPCATVAGCVPFNIFGGAGTITPAMLNYVQFEEHDLSEVQLRDYTANINGSLADLPAGPLGFAAGYEYLEDNGFFHPDSTVSSGNTTGNVTQPTDGREKTAAEYFEFDFPLIADAPAFKMLDLDVAERWSQFKWFGGIPGTTASDIVHSQNAQTGRWALKWQPTDSLLIRGSWSQGFRIPNISDLFFGNSDSFPTAQDPCAPGPDGGWDGIPADLPAACGGHSRTQPNAQIKSTVGGNPNLVPEKAKSRTFGFVYNPDWIPGFDFSADYYNIEVDKAVGAVAVQTILNGCYPTPASGLTSNPADCALVKVSGPVITDIFDGNQNLGALLTNGVDVASHYKLPSTGIGDFKVSLDWTFLRSFIQVTPVTGGFVRTQFVGTTTGFGGFPKQKANFGLGWNYGSWSAAWNVQYIAAMFSPCIKSGAENSCSNPTFVPKENHVGATVYNDVQATYHDDGINTDFTLGVRNLFDKQPPSVTTAFANSFLPAFYRVPGIQLWGRITVKF